MKGYQKRTRLGESIFALSPVLTPRAPVDEQFQGGVFFALASDVITLAPVIINLQRSVQTHTSRFASFLLYYYKCSLLLKLLHTGAKIDQLSGPLAGILFNIDLNCQLDIRGMPEYSYAVNCRRQVYLAYVLFLTFKIYPTKIFNTIFKIDAIYHFP